MAWGIDDIVDTVSNTVNSIGNVIGGGLNRLGVGASNATGMSQASSYQPFHEFMTPSFGVTPTINTSDISKQIGRNVGLQKQQNIAGYNAAVASQAGINPALAAQLMGNNLAYANQQAGNLGANQQADAFYRAQLANQQAQMQANAANLGSQLSTNQLNSANYNAAMSGNQAAAEAQANRGAGFLGGLLGGVGSAANSLFGSSDERVKQAPTSQSNASVDDIFHQYFLGVSPTAFNSNSQMNNAHGNNNMGMQMQPGMDNFTKSMMKTKSTPDSSPAYMSMQSSDRNNKNSPQELNEHDHHIQKFLDSLQPYMYSYKPNTIADDGGRTHMGIMAQNLEKTPAGSTAVMDTPAGKMVDIKELSTMIAAGLGNIHERLKKLEKFEKVEGHSNGY